jgi:5-methylcytosine-specific restriction endonuclease McrA
VTIYPIPYDAGRYIDRSGPVPVERLRTHVMRMMLCAAGRDPYLCEQCGTYSKARGMIHLHHIIPRRESGPETLDNIAVLCAACHYKEERSR